jgi:hypothetical protein
MTLRVFTNQSGTGASVQESVPPQCDVPYQNGRGFANEQAS